MPVRKIPCRFAEVDLSVPGLHVEVQRAPSGARFFFGERRNGIGHDRNISVLPWNEKV